MLGLAGTLALPNDQLAAISNCGRLPGGNKNPAPFRRAGSKETDSVYFRRKIKSAAAPRPASANTPGSGMATTTLSR